MKTTQILNLINGTIWAIQPDKMDQIMGVINLRIQGLHASQATIDEVTAAARQDASLRRNQMVAVLPIVGTLTQRASLMSDMSGLMSTEAIAGAFDSLIADDAISAIVLDMDTPGGSVHGVQELSDKIYAARGTKPIIAVANSYMASAGYYIGSAADEVVVTLGGQVGSIGTMGVHADYSEANEKAGVGYEYVTYGEHKAEANADSPLSDEARAELQRQVDTYGHQFEADVARNRGVSVQAVQGGFGQGRMFIADDAVAAGLADRVDTLEDTIRRFQATTTNRGGRSVKSLQNKLKLQRAKSSLT